MSQKICLFNTFSNESKLILLFVNVISLVGLGTNLRRTLKETFVVEPDIYKIYVFETI